ncbi:MAG: hypothetical protein HOI95_11095 [Chromatiales bacterium]|jgi:maleate isomerase|nr:hypothetical protein [Chromatiales bacterium]
MMKHDPIGHADNWGWRARFGIFIVASEAVPEAEWWAMVPSGVSVHAARVSARAPWARWRTDPDLVAPQGQVELADDLARGANQFAAMRLEAIVVGHSSSSILGGTGWDDAVVRRLQEIVSPETAVTTNGIDCVAALRASGVHRPLLVFPPWFSDALVGAGTNYFETHGFAPSDSLRAGPGRGWRDLAPDQLYPQGMGFEQDVEALYRQIRAACPQQADGVLIAGTGFRCVGIAESLEQDLRLPVITANQASLWHCMRLCGMQGNVSGYGSLFSL